MHTRLETIQTRLATLSPTQLEVLDDSADHVGHLSNSSAGHYTIRIASPMLTGLSRIAAHRKVYEALGDLIPHEIHACRIEIL